MTCMEARRMVTPYVNRTLTDEETEAFLDHIEHCSDCMEELDIYFTMYKAMDSLDSGNHQEYNFKKMLEEDIHTARRAILTHKLSRGVRFVIVLLAEFFLIWSVFTGYEMQKGQPALSTFQRAILRMNPRHQGKQAEDPRTPAPNNTAIQVPEIDEILAQQYHMEVSNEKEVPESEALKGNEVPESKAAETKAPDDLAQMDPDDSAQTE